MRTDTTVDFAQDGALGILTLDNPPLNLISAELISDLGDAIGEVETAREIRALLVRGNGKVFSAGADVALFAGKGADEMRPLIKSFLELGRRIELLSFPTMAAVHGTCIAGAFELALFCDIIWADEGTMLGLPETRLGIVPLAGGVERLAARAGLGRALAVTLGGELHGADELANWGAIDRVVAAAELHPGAEGFARRLAAGPTRAYSIVKELVRAYTTDGISGADVLLLDAAVGLFDTPDAHNGIHTFLVSGAGPATFSGR
jgi:enoyl-CoA hydratase/carnithine racemase